MESKSAHLPRWIRWNISCSTVGQYRKILSSLLESSLNFGPIDQVNLQVFDSGESHASHLNFLQELIHIGIHLNNQNSSTTLADSFKMSDYGEVMKKAEVPVESTNQWPVANPADPTMLSWMHTRDGHSVRHYATGYPLDSQSQQFYQHSNKNPWLPPEAQTSFTSSEFLEDRLIRSGIYQDSYQYTFGSMYHQVPGQPPTWKVYNTSTSLKSQVYPQPYNPADYPSTSADYPVENRKSEDANISEYKMKRERNNIAVRKSREKAKIRLRDNESKVQQLSMINDRLRRQVAILTRILQSLHLLVNSCGVSQEVINIEISRSLASTAPISAASVLGPKLTTCLEPFVNFSDFAT